MSKPPSLPNSLLTHDQLVDSLTSHISLYHHKTPPLSPHPNNPTRSSILNWFSSLSVHQRQSLITTLDFNFTQLLISMLSHLSTRGHSRFIILPDLPTSSSLPSLCSKKSTGLLSRAAASSAADRAIFESVLIFSSREGEAHEHIKCSVKCLDTVTVSEKLVEDVGKFVDVMDEVSGSGFLRGEENVGELGSDWVELEWLKGRGYYSIEAFVANRIEVALRLAWLNSGSGRKRGVKLKEKMAAAGVGANVFWRKKGCVDWWRNLDGGTRRKILTCVVGKLANSLTFEVLKEASNTSKDEKCMYKFGEEQPWRHIFAESRGRNYEKLSADAEFGSAVMSASVSHIDSSLVRAFNSLFVLRDIVTFVSPGGDVENDASKLFFSTLSSVNTISDCIFRTIRGLLMNISLDCTKFELFGEGDFKPLPGKSKGKLSAGNRRKKVKTQNTKKLNPASASVVSKSSLEEPSQDLENKFAHTRKAESKESCEVSGALQHGEGHKEKSSSAVEMEHSQGSDIGKPRAAARRKRKGKNKSKVNSVQVKKSERSDAEVPHLTTLTSENGPKVSGLSENSCHHSEEAMENMVSVRSSPLNSSSANETPEEGQRMKENCAVNSLVHNQPVPVSEDALENKICNRVTQTVPVMELELLTRNEQIQHKETEANCDSSDKSVTTLDAKEDSFLVKGQGNENFYYAGSANFTESFSYEWPTLAPVYFPSFNSHLPPATDRLHLDVGHNWQNHVRQPFAPTMHQARNSPIDNRVLSRPVPMSLDWPLMVGSSCGLTPSVARKYDPGFISKRQSALQQSFAAQKVHFSAKSINEERNYPGDLIDFSELRNAPETGDECDSHWISEEEFELHCVSGMDYNQYFGGGVMYWNSSDIPGTGFSQPPSLSSDDSSWAWREADISSAVDDMIAVSSSYSTNGLTSPTAASFCSPFDTLGPGHQALGYVMSANEVSGKVLHSPSTVTDTADEEEASGPLASISGDVEGKAGDSLVYPILRPIIIPNMSRGSEFKHNMSPCVRPTKREQPRIKRPPSPVVLCVPRAPRPPPPSPVSESRKHRGFPTVRSGSSSPRHWGVRGWYHDGTNSEGVRMDGTEVVWPSWRNKSISTRPMIQPLPGALLQDHLIAMSQLARDQEHPDVSFPLQPLEIQNCSSKKTSLSLVHSLLHDEIDFFCKRVAAENMARKPYINWAVKRVTRSLQVLWPRSRTNVFGSNATGLSLPTSDVDLVVCLPPVRNLEPIKEAGILEGRNGIKETCLQHAARYLANQEWVKNDSLKTVENTAIPIIMLVVGVPSDLNFSSAPNVQSPKEAIQKVSESDIHGQSDAAGSEESTSPKCLQSNHDGPKDVKSVRLDISFKSPSHTGLQTTELVKELTEQFPAATPLALVLKQFLADRSLDQSYSGGLSSYCLILLITRFLQHEHHHGRPINQNLGSLLMDFLYFFGNVFDPRQMRISVQGSGLYINRERGSSIDPIHIDDPLFPANNVGRNCFRIHQCIKAFSEAYSILENELSCLPDEEDKSSRPEYSLLPKIISSNYLLQGI